MAFSEKQVELLNEKLDPKNVHPPSKFGPKGDYIEGWHAISEANRIFGFDGWSYEIIHLTRCCEPYQNQKNNWIVDYICQVYVSVGGVVRTDIGFGSGASAQIGSAYESATKEAATDALKRALRTFGNVFGLALYDKTRENVGVPEKKPQERMETLISGLPNVRNMKTFQHIERKAKDELKPNLSEGDWNRLEAELNATFARLTPDNTEPSVNYDQGNTGAGYAKQKNAAGGAIDDEIPFMAEWR